MATRAFSKVGSLYAAGSHVYEWTGLLNGDDGAAVRVPNQADKAVQMMATSVQGAAGNLRIEGRLGDTGSYSPLNDPLSVALNLGAPGTDGLLKQVLENTDWIRPRVTAGDGATNYAVRLLITPTGR